MRQRFPAASPATPFPTKSELLAAFPIRHKTDPHRDLTGGPLARYRVGRTPSDECAIQLLAAAARDAGSAIQRY